MSTFLPRSALVTGGAGFIGSHFVRQWLADYPELSILTLDRLTYSGSLDRLRHLPNDHRHTFVQGDICNQELVNYLLRTHQVDTIVHFAAETHVDRSISGPATFIQTNIVGTFSLLEAARDFWLKEKRWDGERCRYHQVSTDEVYGSLGDDDPPFSETTPYHPNSPYSASKASGDHLVWSYHHTFQLPVTFSHCSNNFGPSQQREAFIPTVIRACKACKPIPIYGDGGNRRDWLYVEDHCRGIDRVVRQGRLGEKYHFGGGWDPSNLEIAHLICTTMDRLRPISGSHAALLTFVPDRPGHDWRYAINDTKSRTELAWQPSVSFAVGLEKTVTWYLEN
ncbi:MAG: dTDP-glucose 4,6-dehydratase [Magnetococcales bacterium]|nr:dTDP-glucose 4,6-dehydratase [Magnetococcales bacterium]